MIRLRASTRPAKRLVSLWLPAAGAGVAGTRRGCSGAGRIGSLHDVPARRGFLTPQDQGLHALQTGSFKTAAVTVADHALVAEHAFVLRQGIVGKILQDNVHPFEARFKEDGIARHAE